MNSCQLIRKETKMDVVHLNQKQLAARWNISEASLFSAHGLNPMDLLVERPNDTTGKYFDFAPALDTRQALKPTIETNAGLVAKEAAIRAAFEQWWQDHSARITALSGQMDNAASLVALRNDLLASFSQSLEAIGLLDPFQVRGIVAGFWYQTKYEFLTLMARGAKGVADAWRTSIVTALEDKASKESPLEHKLVKFLMSDFVEVITALEAKKAELDSQIKAASPKNAEGEDGEAAEAAEGEADEEQAVDEEQLKAWKKELTAVKKQLKAKNDSFKQHIGAAVEGLTPEAAAELLLTILHNDMRSIVEHYMAAQREQIVGLSRTGGSSTG
jgi:type I restriction enzyme M protein